MRGNNEIRNLVTVWSLRAISRLTSFTRRGRRYPFNEDVLETLGLGRFIDRAVSREKLRSEMAARMAKAEGATLSRKGQFFRNIAKLAEAIGLSECEVEILTFSLLLQEEDLLRNAMETVGDLSMREFYRELSVILKLRPSQVENALHQYQSLASSGLLQINKRGSLSIPDRLEPLDGLADAIREGTLDRGLSEYFGQSPEPQLTIKDFKHLGTGLGILRPFLKSALSKKSLGCNVLLYGPPGTGKTELVRTLARDLSARLFEVSAEDEDGDPSDEDRRFRSYLLCQKLFSRQQGALILFDEVEDVFLPSEVNFFTLSRQIGDHKGWTNHLLESNPVPAVWIANTVDTIDPAFIRRFDLVMKIPVPPQPVRRQMLKEMLRGIPVSEEWIEATADSGQLTPSHIEKAVKVAKYVGVADREESERLLYQIIANAHEAMGFPHKTTNRSHLGKHYDIHFINPDTDLNRLVDGLKKRAAGRICLYGPPGSGKTAFVHYLGDQLAKPVILKRAPDLLSCYVGQTEKAIAAMFEEARLDNAVLLLDEADSFLQNRTQATYSWEITLVNELLVQMESFDGIFFCATNLLDVLDSAVFRRFDAKVKFDYLKPEQAVALFEAILRDAGECAPIGSEIKTMLTGIRKLTAGDFAAVQRKIGLAGEPVSAGNLLEGLQKECAVKPGRTKPVGF